VHIPTNDDPELMAAIHRYVSTPDGAQRRYLKLLGGNFESIAEPDRSEFLRLLAHDAEQITDHELGTLLDSEWRSRITAAWLIATSRRHSFRERLGGLLLASELTYSGQGHCIALARLGTTADAEILTAYLDHYLRRLDCRYDQPWALGALMHIDEHLGTGYATPFIQPNGLWHTWAGAADDPQTHHERIAVLHTALDNAAGK